MTPCKIALGSLTALLALGVGEARAQAYQPRPPVSPYINLLRRGIDPAISYYGLVRPQLEQQELNQQTANRQADIQRQLQMQQEQLQNQDDLPNAEPTYPTTGHGTSVLSYGRYFQSRGSGGAGFGQATGGLGFNNRSGGGAGSFGGSRFSSPVRGGGQLGVGGPSFGSFNR